MSLIGRISPWTLCAFSFSAAVFLLLAAPALAQGVDEEMEREAQAIDRMIMCPVCPAETIDQAQVEISFQMRAIIRDMLREGRTREQILDYFVDRYGRDILAAPPKSGANLLAWILPIAGIAVGLVGVFLVIRSMTGRQGRAPVPVVAGAGAADPSPGAAEEPGLAPYLEIADRLLATRRNSRQSGGPELRPEADQGPGALPHDDAGPREPEGDSRNG